MPHRDPVTGASVWLDVAQPLAQVDTTLALLRVWQQARPQQVLVDIYQYKGTNVSWGTCRN